MDSDSGDERKEHSRAIAAAPTPRGPTRAELERSKILDALEDAGIVVPAGVLPVTRLLTPAQKLRKKELRDELHRLKLLEDEYREEFNRKKDEWTSSRKELVDQLAAHDESYKTEIEPDEKRSADVEDAGVVIPEGVLPPTRDLTEELEREHNEALRIKTEQWDAARKALVDALKLHDSERQEEFAPDHKLSKEYDEKIKSAVSEIKGLV
ncbi:hypothetical protein BO83DRAFT_441937 [Aspergillus eucalypticola CBS 122712]|uniref:Uncharacterized protein n=1 Tax=Aspergillus eucalypticola (strain CBS 122712 / IBT 29274) TaxID=1448314 RepID=A0A317ULR8_ASPEC|nr:uncharacterized protein BO83DRAFT_441937 [Aspergillus eucalypticola CBS 122712]PWY62651.1 hypothetical protein BO83DRAFT_441937 [Aspergillus eucalypticola CBS 122712]